MEDRKIEKVLYMKFNNNDKRGALLYGSREGVVIIDKPFKKVLEETIEIDNTAPCIEKEVVLVKDSIEEVELLWQGQIHKNYMKTRGGK